MSIEFKNVSADPLTGFRAVAPSGAIIGGIGDKGYIGSGMVTPVRKPRHGELSIGDKAYNRHVSSLRAPVEQFIAHFKSWRILHTDYRRPYSTYHDAFDAARALFFFSITWGFE